VVELESVTLGNGAAYENRRSQKISEFVSGKNLSRHSNPTYKCYSK